MYQSIPTPSHFEWQLMAMTNRADRWRQYSQMAQWPGLRTLLQEFSDFANDYIHFLKETPKSVSRSPFVLNMGVNRLLEQWSILSRACEQRLGPVGSQADPTGFEYNLRKAGKFAKKYCDRWCPEGNTKPPYQKLSEPVVYFEKLYGISRAIYAPEIPVISIPLTDYDDPTRWHALPHEVGHHIFWNGVGLGTSGDVHKRLLDAIAEALSVSISPSGSRTPGRAYLWAPWLVRARLWGNLMEELFADNTAALLAGPEYAISAQDRVADRVDEVADLVEDDQEHPCGYLRPLIALQVLREIAGRSTDKAFRIALEGLVGRLESRWMNFCEQARMRELEETGLTMEVLADDILIIVRAILNEPVWPGGRNLWGLIEFYGKQPTQAHVDEIDRMEVAPLQPIPGGRRPIKKYPPKIATSDCFERFRKDLERRVNDAELDEAQKPLAFWLSLLGLELTEAADYHPHRWCTRRHSHIGYCYGKRHRHPMDGSTVICCS